MIIIHYQVVQKLNFHSAQQPEQNTTSTETPELQDFRSPLYLVGDYLTVIWEGRICIAGIITTVSDKSNTCSAILYTEDSALTYTTASEEEVPID